MQHTGTSPTAKAIGVLAVVAAIGVTCPAVPAGMIEQQVSVGYEGSPLGGSPIDVLDVEAVSGDGVTGIAHDILASIGGPGSGFQAISSVGRFGNLGVDMRLTSPADDFSAQVVITSDVNQNQTGVAQHGVANFIIDGGMINTDFLAPGSLVRLQLTLTADILVGGVLVDDRRFQTGVEIKSIGASTNDLMFSAFGEDLGAVFTNRGGFSGTVEIPFSFQTFDLGIIPPGGVIDFEYQLDIFAENVSVVEGLFIQFSDPASLEGFQEFPTVTFSQANPVPEPSSVILLGLGGLGLAGVARGRRRVRGKPRA